MKNMTDPEIAPLTSVIEKEGCPICAVIAEYEFQLLANLQKDIGEQDDVQKEIINHGLFCNYHYHALLTMSNRQNLAKFLIAFLHNFTEDQYYFLSWWENRCYICGKREQVVAALLPSFLSLYENDDVFKRTFLKHSWLCLPHLKMLLYQEASPEVKADLVRHQKQVLRRFNESLHGLISKRYFNTEPFERKSADQVVDMLVGKRGLVHDGK